MYCMQIIYLNKTIIKKQQDDKWLLTLISWLSWQAKHNLGKEITQGGTTPHIWIRSACGVFPKITQTFQTKKYTRPTAAETQAECLSVTFLSLLFTQARHADHSRPDHHASAWHQKPCEPV